MDNTYFIKLVAVIASLILLVATEPFYREFLFNASITMIVDIQSTATPWSIGFLKLCLTWGLTG